MEGGTGKGSAHRQSERARARASDMEREAYICVLILLYLCVDATKCVVVLLCSHGTACLAEEAEGAQGSSA
jgi:hypothetical protein